MNYSVDIKGLKELQANIDGLPKQLKAAVNGQLTRAGAAFVGAAKKAAPKDIAGGIGLAGGISFYPNPVTNLSVSMVSAVFYSPYLEWGTITRVFVPAELQAYAIQFKGKGLRTNGGIYPHPFFFPQLPIARKIAEDGIKAELEGIKL